MIDTSEEEEDAIPQVESQRPGTVPAVFVELDEDSLKALKGGWVYMYASDARVISRDERVQHYLYLYLFTI